MPALDEEVFVAVVFADTVRKQQGRQSKQGDRISDQEDEDAEVPALQGRQVVLPPPEQDELEADREHLEQMGEREPGALGMLDQARHAHQQARQAAADDRSHDDAHMHEHIVGGACVHRGLRAYRWLPCR